MTIYNKGRRDKSAVIIHISPKILKQSIPTGRVLFLTLSA